VLPGTRRPATGYPAAVTPLLVVRRIMVAIAWLVVAALVSLGGAGVVAALNHVPGTDARPELTWTGDAAARPAMDAATLRLQALSDAVDQLGGSARQALASLVGGDTTGLSSTIDTGTTQLAAVSAADADLATAMEAIPHVGTNAQLYLSASIIHRYGELAKSRSLATGLESDWAVLSARALAASSVPGLLARHDQETAAAAKEGSAGHYQQALALLDAPDATIAQARAVAAALSKTVDVSTFTAWLDRNEAYDKALRTLYSSMLKSRGRVTDTVRKAFAAQAAALAALPADTKPIVVIMSDIAQGGLNQAVIDIETARGLLRSALDVQRQLQSGASPAP
jgi:hypothetical protein